MMIDAACRQSSYLLPLLTNKGHNHNKMKRNATNDNREEVLSPVRLGIGTDDHRKISSPRKKLKFGVDAILGTHSDNDSSFETGNESDDDLRHKGKRFVHGKRCAEISFAQLLNATEVWTALKICSCSSSNSHRVARLVQLICFVG